MSILGGEDDLFIKEYKRTIAEWKAKHPNEYICDANVDIEECPRPITAIKGYCGGCYLCEEEE